MEDNEPMSLLNQDGGNIDLSDLENRTILRKKILIRIVILSGIFFTVLSIVLAVFLTQNNEKNNGEENNNKGKNDEGEEKEYNEIEREKDYEEKDSEESYEVKEREEGYEEKESEESYEKEEEVPIEIYGNILCTYNITSGEINILSDEFENNENLLIYINNQKKDFTKKYNFDMSDSKTVRFEILSEEFSMKNMFKNVEHLNTIELTSNNNEKITSMESAFEKCSDLVTFIFEEGWDTSELLSMKKAFYFCSRLSSIQLNNLNLSNVKDISQMFEGSGLLAFTPDILDLNSVETMAGMFKSCNRISKVVFPKSKSNDLNISSKLTNMSLMFSECNSLNQLDISVLNTENVIDMSSMFEKCNGLSSLDLSNLDTNDVQNMKSMFESCSKLRIITLPETFDFLNVVDTSFMFKNVRLVRSLDLSKFTGQKLENMRYMFSGMTMLRELNLSLLNPEKLIYMDHAFDSCTSLRSLSFPLLKTTFVKDMSYTFYDCPLLNYIDISNFETENVEDMSFMFSGCLTLNNLDIKKFRTSKVKNMEAMFKNCIALKELDVSQFDTSNVENMKEMFSKDISLKELATEGFDTKKVIDMRGMFFDCSAIKQLNLGVNFRTDNVENMGHMFRNCFSLTSLDVSNFITSKVTSMEYMFYNLS